MSDDVKRWRAAGPDVPRRVTGDPVETVEVVSADDYDALRAERDALREERDEALQRIDHLSRLSLQDFQRLRGLALLDHEALCRLSRVWHASPEPDSARSLRDRAIADALGGAIGAALEREKTARAESARLRAERDALRDELRDWQASATRAASEACPPDEHHCTCVGLLRAECARLAERVGALERAIMGESDHLTMILENPCGESADLLARLENIRGCLDAALSPAPTETTEDSPDAR